MPSLADSLKAARKAAGLTQAQVAAACDWDPPSRYSNYEQGLREPTLEDLRKIAAAVKAGGHTYARIVVGEDVVPASQLERLDTRIIRRAMTVAKQALEAHSIDDFTVEGYPKEFAQALRAVIAQEFTGTEGKRDESARGNGQVGRIGRAAGKAKARGESAPAGNRKRKSA